ncbi:MAG: aspartate carbamoyltransferase catalytic subunit [Alphaproteobacteria bacterium]|nr:aspartate carbamoyltransferase catalytic subunit [Alphaproteobacteria bacterium]
MRHLLGIDDLSREDIERFLERAHYYTEALFEGSWNKTLLSDRVILHLFFEHSTRTLTSFEIAAKRLGAEVVNWNPETSSLSKGENFIDTIDTLCAMRPDAIVMRHADYGAPKFVAGRAGCPIINGGDSWRAHPTQALLDALTLRQHFGKIEGLCVTLIGDIAHSRVATSNIELLRKMGAKLRIIAPAILMPEKRPEGVEAFNTLEEGLPHSDVVMTLRLQKERMDRALISSDGEYFREFGLTTSLLDRLAPKAMVMDPGPLVRGVQMEDEVAEDPRRSLILKQVANGIPTRMAVLDILMTGKAA